MQRINRYSRFQNIKQMVKEARNYLLAGVDVGKDIHHVCITLSSGRMLEKNLRIGNTRDGFETLVKRIGDYQIATRPGETLVGLETTGNYMLPLAQFLEEHGIFVVMVSSLVAKRNRDTLDLSWNKNDSKDARNVADCMRQGKILYFPYHDGPYDDLKRLMSLYVRLSRERAYYKVRLQNNILCIVFPEFTKVFDTVDELVPMTLLRNYPTPGHIAGTSEDSFVRDIVNKTDPTIKRSKLSAIHALSRISIGCREGISSLLIDLRYTLNEIDRLRKFQETLLKEVRKLLSGKEEYDLLQTIPGIGPVTAAVLLGEIGNIENYRSSRQILKLAGLDLARIQSGTFEGMWRISRRGRPVLRSAAFQAGLVAARHPGPLRLKYLQLVEGKRLKKGERRKAVIAMACRILRIVYAVLKTKTRYNPDRVLFAPEMGERDTATLCLGQRMEVSVR